MSGITFDPEKFQLSIARLKTHGDVFEVVIDPDEALRYRDSQDNFDDVLKYDKIFCDAQKGLLASEQKMEEAFGSDDTLIVARKIVVSGELHLTTEYKAKLREQRRKQIIQMIHREAVDPRTKLPHPVNRIETALLDVKVKIDEFKRAEDQLDDIVKLLKPLLPISFDKIQLRIRAPAAAAGKVSSIVHSQGKLLSENWNNDGSYTVTLEVVAGIADEIRQNIMSASGLCEVEIITEN